MVWGKKVVRRKFLETAVLASVVPPCELAIGNVSPQEEYGVNKLTELCKAATKMKMPNLKQSREIYFNPGKTNSPERNTFKKILDNSGIEYKMLSQNSELATDDAFVIVQTKKSGMAIIYDSAKTITSMCDVYRSMQERK